MLKTIKMNLESVITNNVDYNVWVAEQLVNWLRKHPIEILHKECPSSFNSIAKTLKHISDTQLYWSSMIRETETPQFDYLATEVIIQNEMDNLLNEALLLNAYVKENVARMSERYLIESPWFTANFPKFEYLQHLIIHTTYHRGQIVTIGRNVGITDAPMLDYNFWNVKK